MLEDIALMRVLPGMRVLVPADFNAAKAALRAAALTPGPFYVRLGRAALPEVYPDGFELEVGKAYVLREGTDVTLAACGVEVAEALKAADLLAAEGISAEVIDVATIKPIDADDARRERSQDGASRDVRGAQRPRRDGLGGLRGAVRGVPGAHASSRRRGRLRHVRRAFRADGVLRADFREHRGCGAGACTLIARPHNIHGL